MLKYIYLLDQLTEKDGAIKAVLWSTGLLLLEWSALRIKTRSVVRGEPSCEFPENF